MATIHTEGINTKGMDELIKRLEKMSNLSDEQLDMALTEGAKIVKRVEVDIAKDIHDEYSEDKGWREIETYKIKKRRNGARIIQTGIRAKQSKGRKPKGSDKKAPKSGHSRPRDTHWNKIRGLEIAPLYSDIH